MIICNSTNGTKELSHNVTTVQEFIDKVIMHDLNRYKKSYFISTKEQYDGGKNNMVLYWQNETLKSHHSAFEKFDYTNVMDWEICSYYYEKIITVDDIVSMDKDDIDSKKERLKRKNAINKKDFDGIMKKVLRDQEISNKRNIRFKDDVTNEELIECVKVLVDDYYNQVYKNYSLKDQNERLNSTVEKLEAKIKWLEYRMDNKF
jgi:hypothetical protein